jgi:5-methylcytosine-specific restriction endonuclease McrA
MAKTWAKKFYNSILWKRTQANYRQLHYGICERCGRPDGIIVHHKIYLTENNIDNPNIALNFNNLELLCIDCHNQEHNCKHKPTQKGLKFNSKGELIQIDTPHNEF